MAFETILFEMRGPVGILTFNRPERLNAINRRLMEECQALFDRIEGDESVRALVVTGAGRAFSSGFDLKDFAGRSSGGTVAEVRPALERDLDFIMRFWRSPLPTVAAVKGFAIAGGCELAMACDITVAATGTRFGEPELRFGSGVIALLMPWMAGPKRTKEALLTGNDKITAEEALAMGLINRVVPEGQELDTALAIAREIAVNDRQKVAMVKRSINRAYDVMGMEEVLQLGLDADVQIECLETPEGKAFKEIAARDGLKAAIAWRDARFNPQD